jgi:DNA gyrase subunit A
MTLGVLDILREWIRFRMTTYKRELSFDLKKKQDKLHLLLGLAAIFLDIDKAIRIIRNTQKESEVVKNLMEAFSLTQIQAEYIAEIKLRHLNREYIVNRISEIETLQQEIARLEEILRDDIKVKREIAKQLAEIKKKYAKPRRTMLITNDVEEYVEEEEEVENYPVHVFLTKEGYFKKITPQSMKANDEQKLKEDDEIIYAAETDNRAFLCVFSNQAKMYRIAVSEFDTMKASVLGDYLPAKLGMDQDEYPIGGVALHQYVQGHNFGFVFENGKAVKTPVTAYETKVKRKKLVQAYSSAAPCIGFFYEPGKAVDVLLVSKNKKGVLVSSALITQKQTRGAMGSTVFELKRGDTVVYASSQFEGKYPNASDECRKRKIPAAGNPL